jgi:hypothetical protein
MKKIKTISFFIIAIIFLNFISCCSLKNYLKNKNELVNIENDTNLAVESVPPILVDSKKIEKVHDYNEEGLSDAKEVSCRAVEENHNNIITSYGNHRNYHTNSFSIIRDSTQTYTSSNTENNNKDNQLGAIAYNIPDTMKVGIEYLIRLRISKKMSNNIIVGLEGENNLTVRNIRVANTMEVKIIETNSSEENFKINPLSSGIQSIEDDSSYTTWEWSVRPVKSGLRELPTHSKADGMGFKGRRLT